MEQTTSINVTACDNELYILACTAAESIEICHIKSGYNNPVSYTVCPQSIIASGSYTLVMVGINWGGPAAFTVNLTTGGQVIPYKYQNQTAPVGECWSQSVAIQV